MSVRERVLLLTLSGSQLLLILDGTIVNTAIPRAQQALGIPDVHRQWIVTAYALAFGAMLLIGGRVADYWGRKRTFILGLAVFGAASAWGGLAHSGFELIVARAMQGAAAGLMSPAGTSLVSVTFPRGNARRVAFAVIGAVVSCGAAIGSVLGGVLTEFASWRWCLAVNVPIVALALVASAVILTESRAEGKTRYDFAGAGAIGIGMTSLVYGLSLSGSGWLASGALAFTCAGVVMISVFVLIEHRSRAPLLPLGIIANRNRGGSMLVQAMTGAAVASLTMYSVLYMQLALGMSPLAAGLGMLPMAVSSGLTVPVLVKLLPRIGPKVMMVGGPVVAVGGILWTAQAATNHDYWSGLFPGLVVAGIGFSGVWAPSQNVALFGVASSDAGAAAAACNAANQLGGSVGLATLTNLFLVASGNGASPSAQAAGYAATCIGAAAALLVAAVLAFTMLRIPREDLVAMMGGAPH
jgi:EmrB/QacA subfamily drug resistance transporter